jgi:LCP family protein required for cell wall assembly
MKINAVYTSAKQQYLYKNPKDKDGAEAAGIDTLKKVVTQYMGVPVHYYALIDFTAFQDVVNTVGGIDVTLDEAYSDPTYADFGIKYGQLTLPAGTSHLNGPMALAYARSRHGDPRGDFGRGEHQQKVILGIKDKVLSLGTFSNPAKVTSLLDTLGNRVRTDFSINDIMRIYDVAKNLNNSAVTNVDLAMPGTAVVTTGMVGDQSVVYPKAGIDNYAEVQAFVRSQLKDGFLIKENASIIILNGSTKSGAAQKRADELKSYGYNVIQVADAANKNATETTLIDLTKGQKKYTKHYLEQRLNTTAVTSVDGLDLTQYTADFIIIIGPQG